MVISAANDEPIWLCLGKYWFMRASVGVAIKLILCG